MPGTSPLFTYHSLLRSFQRLMLGGILAFWLIPVGIGQTDCPFYDRDTLLYMNGTQASLAGWEVESPSDGGEWQRNTNDLNGMLNPASGEWLYVSESISDNVGRAELLSPEMPEAVMMNDLVLSFSLVLQTYQGAGIFWVEVYNGHEWVRIVEIDDDFYGEVRVDMDEFAGDPVQLKFAFDDQGEWSWGMGIDDILLTGRAAVCGDGICEAGEACPGDCPQVTVAPGWVPVGEDLHGNPVSYTRFARGDRCDDCFEPVSLGFDFELYEESYQQVFLNANGNLSFDAPNQEFTPESFCQTGPKMIAPFFADVDLAHGGDIWYFEDPDGHYLVVTWVAVGYYGCESEECEQKNTFQAILTDGSVRECRGTVIPEGVNVVFSYEAMDWTTGAGSGGENGWGGSPATVGINLGDGRTCYDVGTFDRPGQAYYGNTVDFGCPPNEVDYLEGRSLTFNGRTGRQVVPSWALTLTGEARNGQHVLLWKTDRPEDWEAFSIEGGNDTLAAGELTMLQPAEQDFLPAGVFAYEPNADEVRNWYRITGISADGRFHSSNWVELSEVASAAEFELVSIGPNPSPGNFRARLEVNQSGPLGWRLTSMSGQVLSEGLWQADQGILDQEIPLDRLPAGTYVFTIRGRDTMQYRYVVKL